MPSKEQFTPAELHYARQKLEVTQPEWEICYKQSTLPECIKEYERLYMVAKRAYRRASHRLHPDKNPGQPEKHKLWRCVKHCLDAIKSMKDELPQLWLEHRPNEATMNPIPTFPANSNK